MRQYSIAVRSMLAPIVVVAAVGCGSDPDPVDVPPPCVLVVAIGPDPVSVRVNRETILSLSACNLNGTVSWTSSDTSIATVVAATPPYAVARGKRAGTAIITAILQSDPGVRDAVTLTVTP